MVEMVVDVMTRAIIHGDMADGDALPTETELCAELGVSRSVLREAVRVLSYRGLLDVKQGRGTIVRTPRESIAQDAITMFMEANRVSFEHMMEFRAPIEVEIARMAALRRTYGDLQSMQESIELLKSKPKRLGECIEAETAFHQALVAATGNPVFAITLQPITDMLRRSRTLTIQHFGVEIVIDHHSAILDAVRDRDPQRAAVSMSRHMDHALRDLRDIVDQEQTNK